MPRGARRLPADCVRLLERADLIVHTGDVTAASVLAELESFAPVAAVHGNMDEPDLRASLPGRRIVEAEGLRIGLVHDARGAAGRHERLLQAFPDCDVIAYGHTHVPEVKKVGESWILNPGSPTERRRAPEHTMIVLEGGEPTLVTIAG
jgi:putative phosphoesterase